MKKNGKIRLGRRCDMPYVDLIALGVDERAVREWIKLERIGYCAPPEWPQIRR